MMNNYNTENFDSLDKIRSHLNNILISSDHEDIKELIDSFHNYVCFDDKMDELFPEQLCGILRTLMLDLEYYVQDTECRAQASSYYGDEKLREVIIEALAEINELKI